jgi:hypothetical protein
MTSNKQTSGTSKTPVEHGHTVTLTMQELEAWRKAAGLHIDPETAEVEWTYAQTLDPYGDDPNLPEECRQVGREYFARSPGGDVWIWFGDLPDATRNSLWEKHKTRLAFPAGLDFIPFALDYLERNFGPISSLSEVELGHAMMATYEAYLAEKNEARLPEDVYGDRDDGAKS